MFKRSDCQSCQGDDRRHFGIANAVRALVICSSSFVSGSFEVCVRWYISYRRAGRAHDGPQMGPSVCTRVRETMEQVREIRTSWRVDETYVSIRGRWHYLYRAVDKHGKTVEFLLRRDRGLAAALVFFSKALASVAPRCPPRMDGARPSRDLALSPSLPRVPDIFRRIRTAQVPGIGTAYQAQPSQVGRSHRNRTA